MPARRDDFQLEHNGEIREALIMIEGNGGAFELLAHGWLASSEKGDGNLFALVRSIGTDRVHLLVHDTKRDPRHTYSWHRIGRDALVALQNRIARLRAGETAPEAIGRSPWLVSASEKPRSRTGL
jgi:hypothetical protein